VFTDLSPVDFTFTFSPSAIGGPVGESPVSRNFNFSGFSGEFTETLRPGFWDIAATGRYNGSKCIAGSLSAVEILHNQTIEKTMLLGHASDGLVNTTVIWSITYDNINLVDKVLVAMKPVATFDALDTLTPNFNYSVAQIDDVGGVRTILSKPIVSYQQIMGGTFGVQLISPYGSVLTGIVEAFTTFGFCTTRLDFVFHVEPMLVDKVLWTGDITVGDYWIGMLDINTTAHGGPLNTDWIVPGTKLELTMSAGSAYCAAVSIYNPFDKVDFFGDDLLYNTTVRPGIELSELLCIRIISGSPGQPNRLTKVTLLNVPEGLVAGP
jgi:hypothetical protein